MPPTVFDRLIALLDSRNAPYQVLRHEPVFTSEQAAAVRGTALASGAKALILKIDDRYGLFVLPADRKLDSSRLRRAVGAKSIRFASADEVLALTTLRP